MPRRLWLVIAANAMLRIAGGASGVLVGIYVADLGHQGLAVAAALVGLLSAVSFGAELVGAIPMGVIADAVTPRALMSGGALVAGFATALFGMTRDSGVFFGAVPKDILHFPARVVVTAVDAHHRPRGVEPHEGTGSGHVLHVNPGLYACACTPGSGSI